MGDFAKTVELWSQKALRNADEVVSNATATLARIAQDRAPEVTGELKDSIQIWINGTLVGQGLEGYQAAAQQAKAGDEVTIGWTADHAVVVEFGSGDRRAHFFVHGAVTQWDAIVAQAVRDLAQ